MKFHLHILALCAMAAGLAFPTDASAWGRGGSMSRYRGMIQQYYRMQQQQMQQYQMMYQQAAQQEAAVQAKQQEMHRQAAAAKREKEEAARQKRIERNKAEQKAKTDVLSTSTAKQ